MLKLRIFLCGCFGFLAALFIFVSMGTIPGLLHSSQFYSLPETSQSRTSSAEMLVIVIPWLIKIILGMPPIMAMLFGTAWWAIKRGKASAGRWAIAASLATLLHSVPLLVASYFALLYADHVPIGFMLFNVLEPAFGITVLVAFLPRNALADIQATAAKPARIAGDGTSKFLDMLAVLLGIGGIVLGINWWDRWGHAQDLPIGAGYSSWLWIIVAALITTAIHECGHATVGVALGMRLRAFLVGPFQWRIRDGVWKFQFHPTQLLSAGGATAIVPTNPDQSWWREVGMIAAGPLASLLSGLIALAIALSAKGSPLEQYWNLFAMVATFSLVGFAVNLLPFRPEALYSDGAQIYQLFRGGPWADLHRAFSVCGSTMVTSLRPRNYDIQAIRRASGTFKNGKQALLLRLFSIDYFIDCGMMHQACEALAEAESIYHESASDVSADLHAAFVFNTAFLRRDAVSARQWWERMEAKKPTHFAVDYWLAQSSLFWIENRLEKAREAWNKGNAMAQQRPVTGVYEYDRYRYSLLRQLLDEAQVAV
jgi:hypothetical protein